MQGKSNSPGRKCASAPGYVSPNQLVLEGFETPFEQQLTKENRWVKRAHHIAWDKLVGYYDKLFPSIEGSPANQWQSYFGCCDYSASERFNRQRNHCSDTGKYIHAIFSGPQQLYQ